jgi:glycosidase
MLKEIIIPTEGRDDIHSITIGVFPMKGRYYRKKMIKKNGRFFIELDMSMGISYYHLYLNDNFTTEFIDINTSLVGQDLKSRVPLIIKSEIFTHLYFENDPRFVSFIQDDLIEFKALSYFSWIKQVILVDEEFQEFDFKVCFEYKNRKYWNLRQKIGNQKSYALKFGDTDRKYWLLENNRASKDFNTSVFFSFFRLSHKQCDSYTFNTGYQIFPDTFCRSEFQIKNKNFLEWQSRPNIYNYFGGDIKGIIERLKFIKRLGIDFIYVNPIFYAGSSHRYNTIDYRKIDPILGTFNDFNALVKKLHLNKIKIVLDVSLNHCSVDFFAFKDILKNQEKSRYLEWFLIDGFTVSEEKGNYSCWHGYKELPQFNLNNEEVQSYLIEAALFWMGKFKIDGWRIDVSNEIPDHFMHKFVKAIKEFKSTTLLIGENLHGESESFVYGAGADGITAYDLYQDIFTQYFLDEKINLMGLAQNLFDYNYAHSFWAIQNSWNFLSNHDLPRFYSILGNKKNYFLAFSMLLIIPGTPVIYYGEELMLGGEPEDNRCSMNWNEYNVDDLFFLFLKNLIKIRYSYKEIFKYGILEIPLVDDNRELIVIARRYKKNCVCFILNFSEIRTTLNIADIIGSYKSFKVLRGNVSDNKEIEILNKDTCILLFEC